MADILDRTQAEASSVPDIAQRRPKLSQYRTPHSACVGRGRCHLPPATNSAAEHHTRCQHSTSHGEGGTRRNGDEGGGGRESLLSSV
eukprot:1485327-Rhodomonas_salina.1